MGSGKYGALTGAISRMQMLENINRNLANANTSGYKKGIPVFEAKLAEAQASANGQSVNLTTIGAETIDFSQGQINKTGVPVHLAINGEGFFKILQENGEIGYTRRGGFQRNLTDEVVTPNGGKLLGAGDAPVILPKTEFSISGDGSILTENQVAGTIPIYLADDTRGFTRGKDGVFVAPQNVQMTQSERPEILQGYLEGSNVNVMQETARMVYTLRAFEATQKALSAYDDMDKKLAELGNLQ